MYNVLIADDDVDAWFSINALLRRYLMKANFVTNLNAARQFIDKQIPSILFFDKQLQDHSSFDFVRDIRSKYPQVKIIIVDAHSEESRGARSMADLNISKPFAPEVIELAIIKLISPQSPSFQSA